MNQIQITRQVFARLGRDLRARSEAFAAIFAPPIFLMVLLSALLSGAISRMPRTVNMRAVQYVELAQLALLLFDWVLAFFVFGALAALASGARSVGECWRRAFAAGRSLTVLALLCWIVWLGLSLTRPLLARKLLPALQQPYVQIGWIVAALLILITLLTCVPERIDRKVGAMDALANSLRWSGSDYLARFSIALVFALIPQAALQSLALWIGRNVQRLQATDPQQLQQWVNRIRIYGFLSYLLTLLLVFLGLYAFCLVYQVHEKHLAENPEDTK